MLKVYGIKKKKSLPPYKEYVLYTQFNIDNYGWPFTPYYSPGLITIINYEMNNYIVRSYRDVIVVTKIAKRISSKAQSIVMY